MLERAVMIAFLALVLVSALSKIGESLPLLSVSDRIAAVECSDGKWVQNTCKRSN